jgi:glyoxylase-like metal-dependent hydrolase (beta-lactamase superfamily II)
VLDLGNRAFEVLHLPGHSPGCIALYDAQNQDLFSGDIIYDGDLLDQLPGSDIPTYISTYEHLQRFSVEAVYPGHYQIFGQNAFRKLWQTTWKLNASQGVLQIYLATLEDWKT